LPGSFTGPFYPVLADAYNGGSPGFPVSRTPLQQRLYANYPFMARSKSSSRWMQEHVNDPYVKRAQVDGYRSRASYKLLELIDKDNLVKPGMIVLDLGSAPGSWSQVVAPLVGTEGRVIASDILPMSPLAGVEFIQGDFTEETVAEQILAALNGAKVDLVLSDMSPNISGIDAADQASSIYLVELALDMARQVLKPKGNFVAKAFHGGGYDEYLKDVRTSFEKVAVRKPDASRARSREVYIVAKGFNQ
jgi:23S rRNA (uridine2552-2'-O)-methyltransferase